MSANSDKILYLLKIRGAQRSQTLADELGLTNMGVRQHLLRLKGQQLVAHFNRSEKVGRPAQYWQLTEKALERFPDGHQQLSSGLLEAIEQEFGKAGLEAVIRRREAAIFSTYQQHLHNAMDVESRLQGLTALRDEQGYMAQLFRLDQQQYLLVERHCPIVSAAQKCTNLCQAELHLFQQCLGDTASVQRQAHLLNGDQCCCYLITVG